MDSPPNPAQQRFNEMYITATEISREMNVSRPSVLKAKKRGLLPNPITVGDQHVCIWERAEVRPALDAWKIIIACRKGQGE